MVEGRQNILGITPRLVIDSWLELLSTPRVASGDLS
jgi:hypothetical protein